MVCTKSIQELEQREELVLVFAFSQKLPPLHMYYMIALLSREVEGNLHTGDWGDHNAKKNQDTLPLASQ